MLKHFLVMKKLVSIPFSAGQRLKEIEDNRGTLTSDMVSIPFSAGQRHKVESLVAFSLPADLDCFYPFFSRAKT